MKTKIVFIYPYLLIFIAFFTISCASSDGGSSEDEDSTPVEFDYSEVIPLPDTGQGSSFTLQFGEDSDYTVYEPSYKDNSDDTISDNNTGLMWQKSNDDTPRTWSSAVTYCDSLTLAGHTDWRLPNIKELHSIGYYKASFDAINTNFFGGTRDKIWSNTLNADSKPFYFSTALGYCDDLESSSQNYVHCVRGRDESEIWAHTYTDGNNETVFHKTTGLIWQKTSSQENKTWEEAISYCENLTLADYDDWRLPNIKELFSLVKSESAEPAIDQTYFPNTPEWGSFWSSTTQIDDTGSAWIVGISDGSMLNGLKTDNYYYTRCVRRKQDP